MFCVSIKLSIRLRGKFKGMAEIVVWVKDRAKAGVRVRVCVSIRVSIRVKVRFRV